MAVAKSQNDLPIWRRVVPDRKYFSLHGLGRGSSRNDNTQSSDTVPQVRRSLVDFSHTQLICILDFKHDENAIVSRTYVIPKRFVRIIGKDDIPTLGSVNS